MASTAAPRAASSLLWEHHHHYPMDWDTLQGCPCCLSLLPVGSCCGVLGCPQRPFVVSWGCLCFPAPLGASARAGAQPDFLHHPPPPQSPGLQSPPGHVQLSRLSLGSCSCSCSGSIWVFTARGICCNTSRSFSFPGPSGASLAPQGFLTISHTNLSCFSSSQSLFPEKISCKHPGVSLLQLKPFGGFHVSPPLEVLLS